MSRLDSFDFDSPLWELPAQSPAFPAFAASGVAASGSSVDPSNSGNVAAATPSTHPYATSASAQPPSAWAMDASAHAWLGGGNPVAATTAPTSSVSTLARPASLAAQNGSGPVQTNQGTYLGQMPLPNMAIPAGARVTTGTASSTSTAAEAAAATLAASSSSTDTSRLQQASDALRALMADHAPASLGHALAAAGQPGGALAPGQQQQQQPSLAHAARAPNAGLPASTSAPSSSSAAAAHQSPFANISANTYAALINQANSTLYGSQPQQSQLGGAASMASTSAAAAAALAAAAQYGMPMQLNLRQPPPPQHGGAARGSASPFPPNVAMQFAAGVGAAPGGPVASPALPQYAFSAADLRAQQQQQQPQQGSPLVAAGLAQQQQQQQRFQSHQPPQPQPQQLQQGGSEAKPAEEQRMVNGNGNGSSSASVEPGQQANRSPLGSNSQAASASGAQSVSVAPAPLTVSTSTSGPDASTSASVKSEATPNAIQGYSPDDPYIPSLGRGSSNPRSATANVTYHEDSPPELSCPSDDSADEDFGKQQRSSKGGRKSSTSVGGTAAAAGGRGRQKTRRAAAVAAASGLGVGASKAGAEAGSAGEAASSEFAPAVAGGSTGIIDPAIEGGAQPGGGASRDSSTDGKPTLTNRKRASPATTPGAIDPVTGFMRRTTEIPAVEDDPSIRPYGCNWCFVKRKEAERIARRQRRAAAAAAAVVAPLDRGLGGPQPVVMPNLEEASGSSASQLHAYQHLQQQQQQHALMQPGEASTSGQAASPSSSLPVQPASSFAHSVPVVTGQSSPSAVAKGKARARDAMAMDGADEDADGETDPEDGDELGAANLDAATTTGAGAGAGISDSDDEEALDVVANDPNLPAIQWRTVKELREHMSKDHKDRPIKSRKEEDETTGPLDMPFRCALIPCDKTFKSLAGLRFHFQNASTNGHFTVSVELDAETGEERATKRFKQDAKPSGRELKCPIPRCPKRFKQSAGLAYHLSHTPNHTVSEAMLETFEATLASKTKWWYNRLGKSFAQE